MSITIFYICLCKKLPIQINMQAFITVNQKEMRVRLSWKNRQGYHTFSYSLILRRCKILFSLGIVYNSHVSQSNCVSNVNNFRKINSACTRKPKGCQFLTRHCNIVKNVIAQLLYTYSHINISKAMPNFALVLL